MGAPSQARVVWVSGAFGYDGELGGFGDVFREFAARFPRGAVAVAHDFPVARYPGLPLEPLLRFHRVGRTARGVGGVTYRGRRRIPTLGSLRRIAALRPDVLVLVECTPTALGTFALARLLRRRTVLLVESDPAYRGAPGGRAATAVKRYVAGRADAVLVSNALGARFVRGTLGVEEPRLLVGPYLTSAPAAAPATTGHVTPVRFLFVNSVTARKGLRELVTALLAMAPEAAAGWELDVAGSGDQLEELRRLVAARGAAGRVRFHGRVAYADLGRHYAAADVVVCPSLADYRSLAGFEAVNARRPVLVSRYDGAHEELVASTPAAVLVDPRDRPGFSAQLQRFVLDPAYRARLATAARTVPPEFTAAAAADNLARAVRVALGAPEPART